MSVLRGLAQTPLIFAGTAILVSQVSCINLIKVLISIHLIDCLGLSCTHACRSGAVYIGSESHVSLLNSAYAMFALSNPLHADVWPSVTQMEAEVISMTAGRSRSSLGIP